MPWLMSEFVAQPILVEARLKVFPVLETNVSRAQLTPCRQQCCTLGESPPPELAEHPREAQSIRLGLLVDDHIV